MAGWLDDWADSLVSVDPKKTKMAKSMISQCRRVGSRRPTVPKRVATGIPRRVRPAALAEPDMERYTIRLPARALRGGSDIRHVKQISCVVMDRVRSVSGHVSLIRYPAPAPLRSPRVTRVHRYYGCLRLPSPMPSSSLVRLVGRCAMPCAKTRISTVTARSPFKLDWACDPGWARRARHLARHAVACWRPEAIGPLPL
jgi:hypothetical protein